MDGNAFELKESSGRTGRVGGGSKVGKVDDAARSWLKGPVKWTRCHLYVIMDVFSRYVVGCCFGCMQPNNMESAYPDPLQWV